MDADTFDRTQIELARRNSLKAVSDKTVRSKYSGKYALTGRIICGECGSKYRRTTWSKDGNKRVVWRCISRLDHGKKYCKKSVTVEEEALHKAIVAAMNTLLDSKEKLKALLSGSIAEILSAPDTEMQIVGIQSKMDTANHEIIEIIRQGVENRRPVSSAH